MSELGINSEWLENSQSMYGNFNLKPILIQTWDKLDEKTKQIFENPKKRGFFKKTEISHKDYNLLIQTAYNKYKDGTSGGPNENKLNEYLKPKLSMGGKKSRKSRKSRKLRKRGLKKSRKSRKLRKSRKSRK